jgi:hypothetical protein
MPLGVVLLQADTPNSFSVIPSEFDRRRKDERKAVGHLLVLRKGEIREAASRNSSGAVPLWSTGHKGTGSKTGVEIAAFAPLRTPREVALAQLVAIRVRLNCGLRHSLPGTARGTTPPDVGIE